MLRVRCVVLPWLDVVMIRGTKKARWLAFMMCSVMFHLRVNELGRRHVL